MDRERSDCSGVALKGRTSTIGLILLSVLAGTMWVGLLRTQYPVGSASGLPLPSEPGPGPSLSGSAQTGQSVVALLGDGFSTGLPSEDLVPTWTLSNLSQSGTGYLARGTSDLPGTGAFADRLSDVVSLHPDVVLVAGGYSDVPLLVSGTRTRQDFSNSVAALLDSVRSALPDATIIVVGVYWPSGSVPAIATAMDGDLATAARTRGLTFADPIGEQWITGIVTSPSTGNAAQYIGASGIDPSPAGFAYLAGRLQSDLGGGGP